MLQAEDEFLPFTFVLFIGLPFACWFCGRLLRAKNGQGPLKLAYVLLTILASLPGITFTLFAGYMSFFSDENLPDVSVYCYALPFFSLVVAIVLAWLNRDLLFKRAKAPKKAPPETAPLQ